MCGRFARYSTSSQFSETIIPFVVNSGEEISGSYNISPSQKALIVRENDGHYIGISMKWGLKTNWISPSKNRLIINARSETIDKKSLFRVGFRSKRCLVLCDGYYEWKNIRTGSKKPYYVYAPNEKPVCMAAIFDNKIGNSGDVDERFIIITKPAHPSVSGIHHRMPIRLPRDVQAEWLNQANNNMIKLKELLSSVDSDWTAHPVSNFVNAPFNNTMTCIKYSQ